MVASIMESLMPMISIVIVWKFLHKRPHLFTFISVDIACRCDRSPVFIIVSLLANNLFVRLQRKNPNNLFKQSGIRGHPKEGVRLVPALENAGVRRFFVLFRLMDGFIIPSFSCILIRFRCKIIWYWYSMEININ